MNQSKRPSPDLTQYLANRDKFPAEELAKYAGMQVAFSLDGLRIVASGKTWDELFDNLAAAGIDASQIVGSYVSSPDEVLL